MESDARALQVWNEARAAAMSSGIYPTDFILTFLMSKQVALLEKLVEQTAPPSPPPEEPKAPFPGQRFAGAPK